MLYTHFADRMPNYMVIYNGVILSSDFFFSPITLQPS